MRVRTLVAITGLVAGASVSVVPPASAGVVINVPAQQPTIQAGINAASNGDTVLVAPGTYFEHIDFKGKAIEVRGADPTPGDIRPVIDGGGTSHVVVFKSGETRASVLRGFKITHGAVPSSAGAGLISGAGIAIADASPTITGNHITDNDAGSHSGGGIGAVGGTPLIKENWIESNRAAPGGGIFAGGAAEITMNTIESNTAFGGGAGVFVTSGAPFIHHNFVYRNHVTGPGSDGGGLRTEAGGEYINNVIVENVAVESGGGVSWEAMNAGPAPYLLNNTIMDNQAFNGSAIAGLAGGALLVNNVAAGPPTASAVWCTVAAAPATVFSHNDVYNGGPSPYAGCASATGTSGNISAEPFPSDAGWRPTSPDNPVIDAGTNNATSLPYLDLIDNRRVADGDGDGVATVDIGALELEAFVGPTGDRYHPLPPARLLDTRLGVGAPAAKLGPGSSLDLQVTGRGGVPDGASAVVLNVAVTNPTATSWLTAWPAGTELPVAANLNFVAGQTIANSVVVKVGAGGKVSLYNSEGSTDVVADVAGWYGGVTGGSGYFPLSPSRIVDTRLGHGAPLAKVGAGATLPVQITGQGGVPSSGVTAVVLNVAVTGTTSSGYLTAWPAGQVQPHTSSLNFDAGGTVPNLVVVKVGSGGRVNLFNSAGSTDIVVDVEGWFGGDGAPGGGRFTSVVPTRVLDTRTGQKGNSWEPPFRLPAGGTLQLGVPGIPQTGVSAVVLNVTVTGPATEGWLTIWPSDRPRPLASNLNYVAGQTVPNLVMVPADSGSIYIYSSGGPVDVVADLAGWYSV